MAFLHRRPDHAGDNYGPHEIEQAVKVATFPATREALAVHYGAKAVQIKRGHAVDLKSVLRCLPEDHFASAREVRDAAALAWDTIRALPPFTGYPGQETWSNEVPAPEAKQHIMEDILGLSGEQHRLS